MLCRLALGNATIDATSFTIVRLVSGALTLLAIIAFMQLRHSKANRQTLAFSSARVLQATMLFIYAGAFSYAYIVLDTGVGALILFSTVQLSMITMSIVKREHLGALQWLGLLLAFTGFVYLMSDQYRLAEQTVSVWGSLIMIIAGLAWAAYTLLGKGSKQPLIDTGLNFVIAVPMCVLLLAAYYFEPVNISNYGLLLAILSGAVTSGIGYAIWYYALEGLTAIQAGVVQLLVPVIAALGGLIWVGEAMSGALILSQIVILGGIALVMFTKPAAN